MPRYLASLAVFASAALVCAAPPTSNTNAKADQWAQWRGPTGQGLVADERVPLNWSENENVVWKTKLPAGGNSTPIIWGERVFLTAASPDGDERYVMCLKAGDGKLVWQQTASKGVPAGRTHEWNGYASASCTTDGSHVYAFFGTPGLFCYDFEGKLIWKHSFGIFTSQPGWGTGASPCLFEDLVIQNCDNDGAKGLPPMSKGEAAPEALVALDKATGKEKWRTPRNQGRGFSTPVLVPLGRTDPDLVLNGPDGIWGYDPRTGKELWYCKRSDPKDQHKFGEPMPVWNDQMLFVASGRPGPCQVVRKPGSGDVTASHVVWSEMRKGHRDVASPILFDGLVYAADSKGSLTCYDVKTGKELYNERIGNGSNKSLGSPVAVRGKLLFVLDDGITLVIEPGPTLKVAGRNKLGNGTKLDFNSSPAIANGRLYLRSQSYLYCIGETK
jgi:outer membrane protein assembly factor BamB